MHLKCSFRIKKKKTYMYAGNQYMYSLQARNKKLQPIFTLDSSHSTIIKRFKILQNSVGYKDDNPERQKATTHQKDM